MMIKQCTIFIHAVCPEHEHVLSFALPTLNGLLEESFVGEERAEGKIRREAKW